MATEWDEGIQINNHNCLYDIEASIEVLKEEEFHIKIY